jgi:hypothetical protein
MRRTNRMLKKSASGVLASLRGSTLRAPSDIRNTEGAYPFAKIHCRANGYTECGPYLLASSLAAALLDGHFEHPETMLISAPSVRCHWRFTYKSSFSASC